MTKRIKGNLIKETPKAFLILDDDLKTDQWYPKSQLSNKRQNNNRIFFNIPLWLYNDKRNIENQWTYYVKYDSSDAEAAEYGFEDDMSGLYGENHYGQW